MYGILAKQEKCGNISPSSSSMISFELSNGDPFGSHVPATLEDDQYVEYQLDDLAGFPSTAEEEERVSQLDNFYIIKILDDKFWILFMFDLSMLFRCSWKQ